MSVRHWLPLLAAGPLLVGLGLLLASPPAKRAAEPAPAFELPRLDAAGTLASRGLAGRPWVLNVWASWCEPCRREHPTLMRLSREGPAPLYGLAHRDAAADALAWLHGQGDPYRAVAVDADGRAAAVFGVRGLPQTLLIGADGRVRWRHVGPLDDGILERELKPLLAALQSEARP